MRTKGKTMTQKERILERLNKGQRVTSLDAYNLLGVTQLSARITELKASGYNITTKRCKGKNRFGEKISYCEYLLVKEEIYDTVYME